MVKLIGDKKIIVKVSLLNPTNGSMKYNLIPADHLSANEFSELLKRMGLDSYEYGSIVENNISCGQLLEEK